MYQCFVVDLIAVAVQTVAVVVEAVLGVALDTDATEAFAHFGTHHKT